MNKLDDASEDGQDVKMGSKPLNNGDGGWGFRGKRLGCVERKLPSLKVMN